MSVHAVCMQKGEAFLASPAVQAALSSEQGKRCSAQSIYALEGQVPADLEAIFCRGIEWDCGVEHVLLLQVRILIFSLWSALQTKACAVPTDGCQRCRGFPMHVYQTICCNAAHL